MKTVKKRRVRDRRWDGQMLLEVLVAVTVMVLVTVAVVSVSTRSLKSARVAGNRQEAILLAETVLNGIEEERLSDVALFFAKNSGSEDCGPLGEDGEYNCTVSYLFDLPLDPKKVDVKVSISWQESGGTTSVDIMRVFSKVRL